MKTIFKYAIAALALMGAASCTKSEPENLGESGNKLYVSHETGTKLTMDGREILWSADDKIGVTGVDQEGNALTAHKSNGEVEGFDGYSIDNADSYVPSTKASFTLNLIDGVTPVAVAYPYFQGITWVEKDDITQCKVRVPEKQKGVKDDIPQNAFAMVGAVEGNTCQLYNVGSVIKFEITRTDIKSLVFSGNDGELISKESWYDIHTGELVRKADSATESVTLIPASGETFEPGDYYFVVAPVKLRSGFTMTLTNAAGQTAKRSTSTLFALKRNTKYTGFGSDESFEFPTEPETPSEPDAESIVQTLTFSDENGVKTEWPFQQSMDAYEVKSPIGPFSTSEYPDITYSFVIQDLTINNSWAWTDQSGLRYGGKKGDYMKISPMPGYRLASIVIRGGTTSTKYSLTKADKSVLVEAVTISTEANTILTLTNDDRNSTSEYRLTLAGSKTSAIREMTLTYELVK